MLLYYRYWHMIKFSEFDVSHGSHLVGIQERRICTHMVIINGKACNDLLIRVSLGYDVGTHVWLDVTRVLWYLPIVSRDEPRELRLMELRISLILSSGVKLSIYNFASWNQIKS